MKEKLTPSGALRALFVLLILLGNILTASAQLNESHYRIYSVKLGKEVSLYDVAEDMVNYDVMFFGEEHNDSVTHYLEQKLFEMLFQKFENRIALSMEMFDRDVQTVMDEYLKGDIRERNFKKDARVWSNYRDYRPMVEFAKANALNLICANAASRYTNLAGRKGMQGLMALPKASRAFFAPLPFDTASGKYYDKLMALSGHSATPDTGAKKKPMMPVGGYNLIMGQSLWDATMAFSIASYLKQNKGHKVMQVNGRFHSDEGYAAVTQLKNYSPKLKTMIISAGSDEAFPLINWSAYTHLGDYIIITDPKVPKTYNY